VPVHRLAKDVSVFSRESGESILGPLAGIRIVEFGGIGPGPMCAMLLADLGADVIRIDRPVASGLGVGRPAKFDLLNRSRPSVIIDLKRPAGVSLALGLIEKADALIEGHRPGTMERIGLGPDVCTAANARLVYGRMTGWGQSGALSSSAGHDLNYIALSGALHSFGRKHQPPTPPLNVVGDFGGGALYLAVGLLSGILNARETGRGQVVDAAMVDGSASLMTAFYGLRACGQFSDVRGTNVTDSGAYYWDAYECADGKFVSVAPIEPKFRVELIKKLRDYTGDPRFEELTWAALNNEDARSVLRQTFASRSRSVWCDLLEGSDACFAPVLSLEEAPLHEHNRARHTFVEVDGIIQPAPAPRFSRTPAALPTAPDEPGASTRIALERWGIAHEDVLRFEAQGVVSTAQKPRD